MLTPAWALKLLPEKSSLAGLSVTRHLLLLGWDRNLTPDSLGADTSEPRVLG